jgi:hypothetical protein
MKKIVFALVVLMVAANAWAGPEVLITCTQDVALEPNVTISYDDGFAPSNRVRAFALDITVDIGTITAVECLSEEYYVYVGSIQVSGNEVTDWGDCVCDSGEYDDTLGGLDTNGVTIEMASLYSVNDVEHNEPPPASGNLARITVPGNDTVCVTIRANGIRGGVVLEDATSVEPNDFNAPGCCLTLPPSECYAEADYSEWELMGKPNCWCYPRQCLGDADGLPSGKNDYYVSTPDLTILKAAWNKAVGDLGGEPNSCADFDHLPSGKNDYRVSTPDLTILKANWNIAGGPAGTCSPGNCEPSSPCP